MYCQHFGLEKKPFQLSSDNSFLWLGKTQTRALDDLKQGIEGPARLLVLTGDVGTGKTTLLHEIRQTLSPDTDCAHIKDPSLELHYLFLTIAADLGFKSLYQEDEKFASILMSVIQRAEQQGRKAVIIIDEVHLVPGRFLTELISWSRCCPVHALTIILAGQLEFHDVIAKSLGRSWKEHVDVHAMLKPLDQKETQAYINQRLALAGTRRKIFIVPAVRQAYEFSKGIPRLINIACDQAMIAAFSKDMKIIDAKTFQEAVGILERPRAPEPEPPKKPKSRRSGKLLAGLAAAVVLGIFAYYFSPHHSPEVIYQIAAPLPALVRKAIQHQPVAKKDSQSPVIETTLPTIPPAIQPMGEKEENLSPLLAEEAQAEFYSPPERDQFPLDSDHARSPDMEKFINEVFMIHTPVVLGSEKPPKGQIKTAAVPTPPDPLAAPKSEKESSRRSQSPGKTPEPDAIIDWLLNKNKPIRSPESH